MLLCVSDDSHEMPAFGELMHDASHAIAQVQKALNSRPVTLLLLTAKFKHRLNKLHFGLIQSEIDISRPVAT